MSPDPEDLLRRTNRRTRLAARWLRDEEVPHAMGDFLHFLGTGGNPSGVIRQIRRTGGFWLSLAGSEVAVDPGPGAAYHAARAGLDTRRLDAVLVSHGHTDHYLAAGALIEGMCRGMSRRRGILGLPCEALLGGLIDPFHRGLDPAPWYPGGPIVHAFTAGEPLAIGRLRVVPFRVQHGPENYGLRIEAPECTVVYSSDTSYVRRYVGRDGVERDVRPGIQEDWAVRVSAVREEIAAAFLGADIAIFNLSFFWQHPHRHLTAPGVIDILRRTGVRRCVVTHFDISAGPAAGEIAELIAGETGADVVAARDGLRLPI